MFIHAGTVLRMDQHGKVVAEWAAWGCRGDPPAVHLFLTLEFDVPREHHEAFAPRADIHDGFVPKRPVNGPDVTRFQRLHPQALKLAVQGEPVFFVSGFTQALVRGLDTGKLGGLGPKRCACHQGERRHPAQINPSMHAQRTHREGESYKCMKAFFAKSCSSLSR